ncbi:hypothetical protein BKA64DRAFT_719035 [Cadophora sp. MPI-SDFR-AT-0126]|nr:hypothetical protein BKA64DRAFT_719035 [Leotiomycetes sp. MPI-SDFR-AT-0126]
MVRHPKSRTGCLQCKTRKIKCDESKPSCHKCVRYKLSCSYLQYVPVGSRSLQQRQAEAASHQHNSFEAPHATSRHLQTLPQPYNINQRPILQADYMGTTFNTEDLHLLHFYTTQTSISMLGPHMTGSNIWGTIIVTLSFSQKYLLYALFSLSALHLSFLHTTSSSNVQQNRLAERYQHLAIVYHTKCIILFQHEIQNLSSSNSAACAACASYLSLFAWASPGARGADLFFPSDTSSESSSPATLPDGYPAATVAHTEFAPKPEFAKTTVPWYKIQRGGHHIVSKTYAWVSTSEYHDIIDPWRTINYDHVYRNPSYRQTSSISPRDSESLEVIASCWSDPSSATDSDSSVVLSEEDINALGETLQTLHYVLNLLALSKSPTSAQATSISDTSFPPPQISASIAALSWTTLLPSRFCDMVENRVPQALVLIAVYCVILKRAEDLWWIKGKAESLLGAVRHELGNDGRWEGWLEWPIREVYGL